MSEIILDFRLTGGRNETLHLLDTLPKLTDRDTLTIIAYRNEGYDMGRFYEILTRHGFDWQPRGGHNSEMMNIVARRRLN